MTQPNYLNLNRQNKERQTDDKETPETTLRED